MSDPRRSDGTVIRRQVNVGELVVSGAKYFTKKHPVISFSWVAGLLIAILGAGFTPSPESLHKFERKLQSLDGDALMEAEDRLWQAESAYAQSKGWFGKCDQWCQTNKRQYEVARKHCEQLRADYKGGLTEAKSNLGVFSDQGVAEARQMFWSKVAGGKQFAQRATMYDAIFAGIGAMTRDENIMSFVARVAINLVINLTMGLIGALVTFAFSVWGIISSYSPGPLLGLLFYGLALLAATSVVVTWILGLVGVTAGGAYMVAKAAEAQLRLEQERRGGAPPNLQQQYRRQPGTGRSYPD